jgi:cytochrome c oxidase subunit 2
VQKWWGAYFGVILAAITALCLAAPFCGWWLPQNVASYGGEVDVLFYVILGLTTFFFLLTEGILVYAMWRYGHKEGQTAQYVHGNHKLELFWTAVPAAILLFIAFAQVSVWDKIKYQGSMPNPKQVVQVTARQWEWRIRYPAPGKNDKGETVLVPGDASRVAAWAESPEIDDVHVVNELHTWEGADVKIYLKTNDVIHSFFLPNLRLKQDALPGKTIPMWFQAKEWNTFVKDTDDRCDEPADRSKRWEISCAELCGGSHYRMRGRLYVHKDQKDYEKWLQITMREQQRRTPEGGPPPAGGETKAED